MQKRARVPCGRALSRARLARMSTVSHAMRSFTSPADGFACHASFTSNGGDFVRHASFYIVRRRFRVLRVCFLHHSPTVSHATRPLTSHGGDFVRHAFTSHAELSHFAHSFTSHGGDFTHCARFCIVTDDFARRACFYTKGREEDDCKGSDF